MAPKQAGTLEKILETFLNQLKDSIGGQVIELKESVDKLNCKLDNFNMGLLEEKLANTHKDIVGLRERLKKIEDVEIKNIKEVDIKQLQAFTNKSIGVIAVAILIIPLLVSFAVGYFFRP